VFLLSTITNPFADAHLVTVMMLCGTIYKRLFDSTSSTSSSAILYSPRSGCSDSSTSEKECVA